MDLSWLAILVLAVVQGATEFLPISSSGHLSLAHVFFESRGPAVLTDVVLHVGTLAAVVAVYRREVATIVRGSLLGCRRLRGGWAAAMAEPGFALAYYVLIGTVVTAAVGLLLQDLVTGTLRGPLAVGCMLLLNGCILMSARWAPPSASAPVARADVVVGLSTVRALVIGLLQGLAVTPGISRSGSTITGSLWMGIRGEQAARFSFLLSIPAILGALVLQLKGLEAPADADWTKLVVGMLVSACVGYVCLRLLVRLLAKARFHQFAWYCWALGATAVIWALVA